jgi:hypothetical protein
VTVSELIAQLQALPSDMVVAIGHPLGWADTFEVRVTLVPAGAFGLGTALPEGGQFVELDADL